MGSNPGLSKCGFSELTGGSLPFEYEVAWRWSDDDYCHGQSLTSRAQTC